jgi:NAD(P)H-dependent FMN reductase
MTDDRRFLFVLTSARRDGNSEALARIAAASLAPEVEQRWLSLLDLDLPPFEDIRHSGDGIYPQPDGPSRALLEATLWASDLVMVAPLYWYSIPARAKNYLDHWSGCLFGFGNRPGEFLSDVAARQRAASFFESQTPP